MKKNFFISFLFCFVFVMSWAQTEIKDESFQYRLIQKSNGGKVVYVGNDHYFEIELKGELKSDVDIEGQQASNNNFLNLDKRLIQFTTIPIADNIVKMFDLNTLSIKTQKQILDSFLEYELTYQKEEIGVKMKNYVLEVAEDDDKVYYFMSYEFDNSIISDNEGVDKTYKNLYLITIAYNTILVINIPLTKDSYGVESKNFLKGLRNKIKFHNKKFKE